MFWCKRRRQRRSEERADFAGPGSENEFTVEKWSKLQTVVVTALKPYAEAWDAVVAALIENESPTKVEER
jgi:hypothetical protein